MKLKLWFCALFFAVLSFDAAAAGTSLTTIRQRRYVVCGIDAEYKSLAYKQDGRWQGIDADICRAAAAAILGDTESFRLLPVKKSNIGEALNTGAIDIMLGHTSLTAAEEVSAFAIPTDILYYDRVVFASRQASEAQSMRAFGGQKVCVVKNTPEQAALEEYNQKYALGFNILALPSSASAKEAFYLRRCDLISGSEIFIHDIIAALNSGDKPQLLPEEVSYLPVKAYVAGSSPSFNIALRWIINALKLAHAADINSATVAASGSAKSRSLQNLTGSNPEVWEKLGLHPDWVKKYIAVYGNYYQILDRGLGSQSKINLNIKQNDLLEKGGFLSAQPFI